MGVVAIIGIVATVAAAAVSAYAQYESAQTQGKVLKYNAREAEKQAEIERAKQNLQAQQQAEVDRRTRAAARAIQGGSGVQVGAGSSLAVDLESARQAELNFQAIRYYGDVRVRGLTAQSTIDRAMAGNITRQGAIGAGGTLLGGAGAAYGNYARTTAAPKTIQVPSAGTYGGYESHGLD